MSTALRPELGEFSSIVCFKAVITGMEDSLGEKATAIALVAAGRARGKKLAEDLGLVGQNFSMEELTQKVSTALGSEGTRLLIVEKIEQDGENYRVYNRETVCSAGEPNGSERKCTFTLGALQGALEAITGKRFRGVQTESVLRGGSFDVFQYTPLG